MNSLALSLAHRLPEVLEDVICAVLKIDPDASIPDDNGATSTPVPNASWVIVLKAFSEILRDGCAALPAPHVGTPAPSVLKQDLDAAKLPETKCEPVCKVIAPLLFFPHNMCNVCIIPVCSETT